MVMGMAVKADGRSRSEPVAGPYGSIQVPGGVEPIILHRDAVSGGGYAMIGTVISADMDRIAQMQPNNLARFVRVDMETALKARAAYKTRLSRLRAALSGWPCLSRLTFPTEADHRCGAVRHPTFRTACCASSG